MSLKAGRREAVGNGPSRMLRREGKIPAILYGPKTAPVKLFIERLNLEPIFKAGAVRQQLLNLEVDGSDERHSVMIKEMQRHPVSRRLLHLDLYEVSMDRKVKVMVPVVITGKSKGVELGGMLQIVRRELEVLCIPNQIPDQITIDVTDLDVGGAVHVNDLQLEPGIEIPADVNFTILTILGGKQTVETESEAEGQEEAAT
ncbi:50S ribosomal protein L25/general stress protein Ctc [Desulfosarcina sp. OttesenSCG-928-A07]|nr:50S ribosomal protein L25/general stress protein Ctc [Desulfosarcina sp. OttesenSCG-928-A07]